MSTEIFQKFYFKLVKTLPMNDVIFMAKLYSRGLLHGDLKEAIQSLPTSVNKSSYFLDNAIKPSLTYDDASGFDVLLNIMEDSEYESVKELAKLIRHSIGMNTFDNG